MKIESEQKFSVKDFRQIKTVLQGCKAGSTEWYFEQNTVFDDQQGSLRQKGILLRLRKGLTDKITLKVPLQDHSSKIVKKMQELESRVGSVDEIQSIFAVLGYQVWLRYEKFRRIWNLDDFKICLDILPFGRYVEIEGPEKGLLSMAARLGLDPGAGSSLTYHELHRQFRQNQGLGPEPDFVFQEEDRQKLLMDLNNQQTESSGRSIACF